MKNLALALAAFAQTAVPAPGVLVLADDQLVPPLDAGGSREEPAEYLLGQSADFVLEVTDAPFVVGEFNSWNQLRILNGATLITGEAGIGLWGSHNQVLVEGRGSLWQCATSLNVGFWGNNNLLILGSEALVVLDGDLEIDPQGVGGNYVRLAGGFLAWEGEHLAEFGENAALGRLQVEVDGEWVSAHETGLLSIDYYKFEEDALVATGYPGLGGHTVVSLIPEPAGPALFLAALSVACLCRRRPK